MNRVLLGLRPLSRPFRREPFFPKQFMNDQLTTLEDLKQLVARFVAEREWRQFHTPKNLAMSLAIEAAELMEHFQWLEPDESRAVAKAPVKLGAIGEELADVLAYTLAMANELGLDLSTVLAEKMQKNASKYPADEFRGRWGEADGS